MGLGLLLTPDKIWTPLSNETKTNFSKWLLQINDYSMPNNNWLFFRVLVNAGLKKVGSDYSQTAIDQALDEIETFYLGDGWYSDGNDLRMDWYIAFAMHYYSMIYARFMEEDDPNRCLIMKDRAQQFSKDLIYWFTEDGDALPFGRSLTYRFAQSAFWSSLAFTEVQPFSWGVIKGIIARNLRSWFSRSILNGSGILTIGYGYSDLNMAEGYNSPCSPLWAFKAFLLLALPDTHPFWEAEEEPLSSLDTVKTLIHPMMIVTRPEKGHVIALTSGQYPGFDPVHTAEKYAKFAYSSLAGFQVPRSYHNLVQAVPDNMLAFQINGLYFVRRQCTKVSVENDIISTWSPAQGITVETTLTPYGDGHLRTHRINLDFACEAVECGFSVPVNDYLQLGKEISDTRAAIYTDPAYADSGLYSEISLRQGEGTPSELLCEANTNILYPRTAMPYIALNLQPGLTTVEVYVAVRRNS